MSVKLELDKASEKNLLKNLKVIEKEFPERAWEMVVTMLYDIRYLAQQKLLSGNHIVTSRLRNSISVKTPDKEKNTQEKYTDNKGKTYDGDMKTFNPVGKSGGVGTNVEYAASIEFGSTAHTIRAKNSKVLGNPKAGFFGKEVKHPGFSGDSFLYWAAKHVNVKKRVDELAEELRDKRFKNKFKFKY